MGKDLNNNELGKGFSQRKDGRYEARAMINGYKIDLYNTDLSILRKQFEATKLRTLRNEKNIRPATTLQEWYGEWFENSKSKQLKSEPSKRAYDRKIRNTYIRLLGDKKIEYVSQMNIQNATNDLIESGYAVRTIRDALGGLSKCMDIAVVNRLIEVNPCTGIVVPGKNEKTKERRVLTQEEQKTFLNEVSSGYYYEVYKILLLTGMRAGELAGLQWQDVDFEKKVIKVSRSMQTAYIKGEKIEVLTTPKTQNSYRIIPFFEETAQCFHNWKKKQNDQRKRMGDRWRLKEEYGDLVFTTTLGSPVTRYILMHDLKKVVDDINAKEMYRAREEGREPVLFEHLHPHAFRHTFATRCFEKGMNPVVIQNIMGHANYSTTISYTHVLEDMRREEIKKVGNFL